MAEYQENGISGEESEKKGDLAVSSCTAFDSTFSR
jgi:hypothetical protein